MSELVLEKEFKNVDIELKNFNELNYEIESNLRADVVFDGPYNIINSLKTEDIEVFLDGSKLDNTKNKSENLNVSVNFPYPDSLKLTRITPKTVKVTIN